MEKLFTCIVCPQGCSIKADDSSGKLIVSGNKCPRGASYVTQELTDPKRTLTAVVRSNSIILPFVPVRTDKAISRKLIDKLLRKLYSMDMQVPLRLGDIIVENFEDSGVNVKICRDVDK